MAGRFTGHAGLLPVAGARLRFGGFADNEQKFPGRWSALKARMAEQTQATLAQLEANLLEAGSGKERIVEAVVYLTDMKKKAEMDAVWCDWIPADGWPNRACVGTALAPGDLVEIKVTALKQG